VVTTRRIIERGTSFSSMIFKVVSASACPLDVVGNHWLSIISTMRSEPKGLLES